MKKTLLIVSAAFIALFGSLQLYVYLSRPTPAGELREKVANLPVLSLKDRHGNGFTIPSAKPVVLIYFNSTCDHCQRQLNVLRDNLRLFTAASLVLMSSQPIEEVVAFTDGLGFDRASNVHVVQITHEELSDVFGTLGLPHIFVYSAEGKLVGLFAGETTATAIAEQLK